MSELLSHDSLPRKEREKLARQKEILKAARELFVSKGFREATLDEIAHHAEFGKGTLYNYFASKEEIFFGIVEQAVEETLTIARESIAAPGDVREKLLLYAHKLISYVKDNGELLHVIYHELHRNDTPANVSKLREIVDRAHDTWEILAEPLRTGIGDGALRNCDPVQLIVLFDGMLRGYCFQQFAVKRTRPSEDYSAAAELITSVFLDGIVVRNSKG
jgi:TetR/AcrR family transcriptional regulator, repressor of fatR-cypB operon